MASSESISKKELLCFFHVDGQFEKTVEGRFQYNEGSVRMKTVRQGMIVEDLRAMISTWIGINCYSSEIKYTVTFDEKILADLVNDAELANLFHYNERSGHVYIACKGNDNPQNIETTIGHPEQSSQAPSNLDNEFEHVSYENGLDNLTYEGGVGPSSLPCGVQSAPTPVPELNSLKWKGKVSGVWQTFANADAFKQALYKYSITHNFEYTFLRNSKERMSVKCKIEGCSWKITTMRWGNVRVNLKCQENTSTIRFNGKPTADLC